MYKRNYISDYYGDALEKIRSVILRESEVQIIGSDTEELAQFYIQNYLLQTIELDPEREPSWMHENYLTTISAHQRESDYRDQGDLVDYHCERIRVEIPIIPNKDIQALSNSISSTRSFGRSANDFQWKEDSISSIIETKGYGLTLDENQTASAVNNEINTVHKIIEWKNIDINNGNTSLLNQIKVLIEGQKNKLILDKSKVEALTKKINIPLKKKLPQGAQKIILDHKPIFKRIKPSPHLPEEYVLDEAKVNDILDVLDNHAKSFEKTPKALNSLGEEALRDLILANLNSIFQGKATGETFSKKGKTDIYLNIDKGSILVFECKVWGGKKLFLESIDQLRGYLTWRHNYGVIITFVRVKNFKKVLDEILKDIQTSTSYRDGVKQINETHFVGNHRVDDEDKGVKIHYLFFNLYCE